MGSVYKHRFCDCTHCTVLFSGWCWAGLQSCTFAGWFQTVAITHTRTSTHKKLAAIPLPKSLGGTYHCSACPIAWSILLSCTRRIIGCLSFGVWLVSLECFSKVHPCQSLCLNVFSYYTWVIFHWSSLTLPSWILRRHSLWRNVCFHHWLVVISLISSFLPTGGVWGSNPQQLGWFLCQPASILTLSYRETVLLFPGAQTQITTQKLY